MRARNKRVVRSVNAISPEIQRYVSKIRLINLIWVLGILVTILILLISFIFYNNRILEGHKVIEFISTGALILSIILSVMAILSIRIRRIARSTGDLMI